MHRALAGVSLPAGAKRRLLQGAGHCRRRCRKRGLERAAVSVNLQETARRSAGWPSDKPVWSPRGPASTVACISNSERTSPRAISAQDTNAGLFWHLALLWVDRLIFFSSPHSAIWGWTRSLGLLRRCRAKRKTKPAEGGWQGASGGAVRDKRPSKGRVRRLV
jgi:hypothetical protein